MLFSNRVRLRIRVRIRFSVWFVSCYAHVFFAALCSHCHTVDFVSGATLNPILTHSLQKALHHGSPALPMLSVQPKRR